MMPTAAWSCVNVLSFRAAQSHIGYRGDYLSWRGLEGGRPIGVNLRRGGAANSSPPPCGEGLGVGVVRGGTALPQPPDPPPRPSPSRNRVYAGFGHSIKRSKSATADFDWGRETRRQGSTVAPEAVGEGASRCPRLNGPVRPLCLEDQLRLLPRH